jgi:hypothetical protein
VAARARVAIDGGCLPLLRTAPDQVRGLGVRRVDTGARGAPKRPLVWFDLARPGPANPVCRPLLVWDGSCSQQAEPRRVPVFGAWKTGRTPLILVARGDGDRGQGCG